MATKAKADSALGADLGLTREQLLDMYRLMVEARAMDERMWVLNRAGKIPFVISGQGHEGAQVGITYGLEKGHDWMVPYYRSVTSLMVFGMSAREIMLAQFARGVDPSSGGRQMPGHYGIAERKILSVSSPVATQLLHATGIALAAKVRKTGEVAMTYLGEGSSNQGDFHEGLNFAGIHRLPVVYVVENNGYAISVPMALQSAVDDIAIR
ncbi:MAG TPA: thiamine pyrophosphate-dependent enzyme, partial [Candidatus Limnocylindrales bacterium]